MQAGDLYERIWRERSSPALYEGGNLRVDLLSTVLPAGKHLLDLGCGDGVLGGLVMNRFEEVVGADVSDSALKIAEQRGLKPCRVNIDDERLPFPDNYFDTIACLDLIEHVFEPRILVAEIARVLAPQGTLYMAFPNMRYLLHIKSLVYGRFPKTSGDLNFAYDGGHLHYYTSTDIRLLLAERNLLTTKEWGIVSGGVRYRWKYRFLKTILPEKLEREFLSIEILLKSIKSL
jgi:methionine biosynthesis protein MetW